VRSEADPAERRTHRVLLVREWDEQMSGSGCCGRIGGLGSDLCHPEDFAPVRERMEAMGAVYRALRKAIPGADITVVDTRNWAWLVPAVVRDARRSGLSWPAVARQVVGATTPASVVVDGVVVSSGIVPEPAAAVAAVLDRIRDQGWPTWGGAGDPTQLADHSIQPLVGRPVKSVDAGTTSLS